jgi:hypothetical protein
MTKQQEPQYFSGFGCANGGTLNYGFIARADTPKH